MKKMHLILTVIISIFILSGCASSVQNVEPKENETKMMVVSSAKPSDVLPAFNRFTWSDEYRQVLSADSAEEQKDVQYYIQNEVIRYLEKKGYHYEADPLKADVTIGYLFALQDSLANQGVQEKFGLLPNVLKTGVTDKRYEKGSFLLMVLDNKLEQIYWRSGVQGFVAFETDKNNHKSNVMHIVLSLMMGDFPLAGR